MANVFMEHGHDEIETAILLEKAFQTDIGNAVAYTDGSRVFINTDNKLSEILPDYNKGMLKWLLWHEEYHKQLRHHNRFFKYLEEIDKAEAMDKFHLSKEEVNIIMDILVHDSLSKMFPDLVETAINNLAQMRNRNSLKYTFKTKNLEDMLDEYAKYKHPDEDEQEGEGDDTEDKEKDSKEGKDGSAKGKKDTDKEGSEGTEGGTKGHKEGGGTSESKEKEEAEAPKEEADMPDEHDKTDWSKLEDRDSKEFITEDQADKYIEEINRIRRMKLKLGRITQTLNGLATSSRMRTYRMPSRVQLGDGIILKGSLPGKALLYLVFDASGSMGGQLALFKEIISKSIPQAMECSCEWFAGSGARISPYKTEHGDGYYKGKFKDIIDVYACSGYNDDGDRTIELCLEAEKKGYSPIGVTDGGGCIDNPDVLKQLKRTILVGQSRRWLERAKAINPSIQILHIDL